MDLLTGKWTLEAWSTRSSPFLVIRSPGGFLVEVDSMLHLQGGIPALVQILNDITDKENQPQ